jgi:hypothetical protein
MTEQQPGGDHSHEEEVHGPEITRREAYRRREDSPPPEPMSEEARAEALRRQDEPLTRADERFRVEDPVEAEHMAHVMDPHYERATAIDHLAERTQNEVSRVYEQADIDTIIADTDDQPAEPGRAPRHTEDDLIAPLEDERTELADAAGHAREAGDAEGELTSQAYRRAKNKPTED